MLNIEHIVRGIIVRDGKILLCRNIKNLKSGHYFLLGGHIEKGESAEEALRREMVEEIGRSVKNAKQIAEVKNSFVQEGKERNEIFHIYLATLENYQNIKSLEDHLAFEWISIDRLDVIDFRPKKVIGEILRDIEQNKDFWIC